MPDADFVQVVKKAIVSVVDTHADVIALTGRDSENIVAWEPDVEVDRPVIAFKYIDGDELAADGDTRLPLFQFSASADDEATVDELLGVVERILTQNAFYSLTPSLDAFVERRIRRGFDLDVWLRVSRSTPLPA